MSPQFAQMLSMMLQLRELNDRRQQFQQQMGLERQKFDASEHDRKLTSAQKFITFLRTLPPEARAGYIQQASSSADVDPSIMTMIGGQVPTDPSTQLARVMEQQLPGLDQRNVASIAATGRDVGANAEAAARANAFETKAGGNAGLWNETINRLLTGQGAGANAMSQATAGIPEDQRTTAAKMALNLLLNAPEAANLGIQRQQLGIQQQQVGLEGQRVGIQGFEANTGRKQVDNAFELGRGQQALEAMGLWGGTGGANAGNKSNEDRLKAAAIVQDLISQLQKRGTPETNQELIRQMLRQIAPQAGLDANFQQYLFGGNRAYSPSLLGGLFTGGR